MQEEQAQRNLSAPDTEPEESGTRAYYDKSWAVIVGINDYKKGHAPLANARNDAEAFAKLLEENLGFKKENIVTLLDDQATRDSIREWLWTNYASQGAMTA